MKTCPKCKRPLKKVFHGEPTEELALESLNNEIIIGNCCESNHNYYCENCDEFFKKKKKTNHSMIHHHNPNRSLSGFAFLNKLIFTSLFQVNFKSPS